jgi:hypothetical protein
VGVRAAAAVGVAALLLPLLLLRRARALMVWMLIASGMSSIRAVSAEVTRTSKGRTHRGRPAAVGCVGVGVCR